MKLNLTPRRLLGSAALATALAACSLIGRDSVEQCSKPEDCARSPLALTPGITVDCQNGLCVEGPPPDAGPAQRPCTVNGDCADLPVPSTCGVGGCVAIEDPDTCPVLLPAGTTHHQDNDAVIVGVYMFDTRGSQGRAAVDLAARQLAGKQTRPRIVPVLCAKGTSKTSNRAAAVIAHLRRLRSPLVIGEFERSELADHVGVARGSAAEAHRVAVWSTLANDVSVQSAALPSDGLYSFLVDEMVSTSAAWQGVIDRAAARAKAQRPDSGASNHLLVVSNTPEAQALANALVNAGVKVDGVPIGNGGAARVDIPALYELPNTDYTTLVDQQLVPVNPRVVIGIGGDEIMSRIVSGLEGSLGIERPVYVVATRAKFKTNEIQDFAFRFDTQKFPERFYGVDFAGNTVALDKFLQEATLVGGQFHTRSYDILYDAMHVVGLAAVAGDRARGAASPGTKLTADDLSIGLRALADGNQPRVTIENYAGAGLQTLRDLGKATFEGVTGVWRFNDAGSRSDVGTSMFCYGATRRTLIYYQDPSFDAGPSDAGCAP